MFQNKVKIVINLSILLILLLAVSCLAPSTKEEYIEKFEKFVNRIEQNHKNYNKKDWKWADSKFAKFNKEWYLDYKGEYTLEDQIKIKSLIIKYNTLKNNEDLGKIINDLFKDDVKDIKGKINDYIENDMEEDKEKLIEGATEIGDSAVKVLEDIIQEIEHSF